MFVGSLLTDYLDNEILSSRLFSGSGRNSHFGFFNSMVFHMIISLRNLQIIQDLIIFIHVLRQIEKAIKMISNQLFVYSRGGLWSVFYISFSYSI